MTVVHNGKKGLSMEEKKIYKVYPPLIGGALLADCILDLYSINDVVRSILSDFHDNTSDSDCVILDYCQFNSFVYHLYLSLSHFVIISFGGFYQLILDTVQVSDVKEGE